MNLLYHRMGLQPDYHRLLPSSTLSEGYIIKIINAEICHKPSCIDNMVKVLLRNHGVDADLCRHPACISLLHERLYPSHNTVPSLTTLISSPVIVIVRIV